MRITSMETIAGQLAFSMRKLMQRREGNQETIAEVLKLDASDAERVFQDLCTENYIEPLDPIDPSETDRTRWRTTIKGNALAHATARKPITRRTAERLIHAFLNRVNEINSCEDYIYSVKQVIIFGSYLSDSPTLGDIDLAVTIECKYDDPETRGRKIRERIKHVQLEGKRFRNML